MGLDRAFDATGFCLYGLHDFYHDLYMTAGAFLFSGSYVLFRVSLS